MMNVVNSGSRYQIYGEDLKTFEQLPNGAYEVCFNKMTGFYLVSHSDLTVNEEKIYGSYQRKVDKVLDSFADVNRNFGVILSGPKGVGKSLFARILTNRAKEVNLPLIIVSGYIPGIADFISSIEQEVIVLFDEFEKTFAENDECKPQEEMLSLFDGIDSGKKLFIITCNEVHKLNSYLLNRPGRFHYHFTLGNPSPDEVREYMEDKVTPVYHHYIDQLVNFSVGANMTYDCLRAIAFELNHGYTLEETLMDLNISKEKRVFFNAILEFTDGSIFTSRNESIDFYSSNNNRIWFYDGEVGIRFNSSDTVFNATKNQLSIPADKVSLDFDEDDFAGMPEQKVAYLKSRQVKSVTFQKCKDDYVSKYLV